MVPNTPAGVEQSGHTTIMCIIVIVAFVLTLSLLMSIFLRYFDKYALVPETGNRSERHPTKAERKFKSDLDHIEQDLIDSCINDIEELLEFEAIVHPYG